MLLENLVAIQLFRIYGHDIDNGRIFFYHDGYEVDRRLILTYDEEETINDKHGIIEIVPVWKWLLEKSNHRGCCQA